MPYLDNDGTVKILALLENTMELRKISTNICKKHYLCKIYQKASAHDEDDDPSTFTTFEHAIIDTFG